MRLLAANDPGAARQHVKALSGAGADGAIQATLIEWRIRCLKLKSREEQAAALRTALAGLDATAAGASVRLDIAESMLGAGLAEAALSYIDSIGSTEADPRARASVLMAEASRAAHRLADAQAWCGRARDHSRAYGADQARWRPRIDAVEAALAHDLEAKLHGAGFLLWSEANAHRLAGRWSEALSGFERVLEQQQRTEGRPFELLTGADDPGFIEQPIPAVYAHLAELHRGECLWRLNRLPAAAKALAVLAGRDGPCQGEALRLWAEVELDSSSDVAKAAVHLDKAIAWFGAVRGLPPPAAWLPPAASQARTAGALRVVRDAFGNPSTVQPQATQLDTPASFQGYTEERLGLCLLRRACCRMLLRDQVGALADVGAAADLDPEQGAAARSGQVNTISRMRNDITKGLMFARDYEADLFPGDHRRLLILAEFWIEVENWDEATLAVARLERQLGRKASRSEQVWLEFLQLAVRLFRGGMPDGERLAAINALLKNAAGTAVIPRARRMLIDELPVDRLDERLGLFQADVRDFPGTPIAARAMLGMVMITTDLRPAECLRLAVALEHAFPDSPQAASARSWAAYVRSRHPDIAAP